MKIAKTKKQSRLIVLIALCAALIAASWLTLAYANNSWPFHNSLPQRFLSQKDTAEETGIDKKTDSSDAADGTVGKDDTPTYVDPPLTNPPSSNDPYPIENEHYKIAQNSATDYHITLYPIVNNPKLSDYDAQLRAYKKEALNYLKHRYGNIDNFTITWTPSDAENI